MRAGSLVAAPEASSLLWVGLGLLGLLVFRTSGFTRKCFKLLLCLAGAGLPLVAQAVFYSNQSTFNAAFPELRLVDFETLSPPPPGFGVFSSDGLHNVVITDEPGGEVLYASDLTRFYEGDLSIAGDSCYFQLTPCSAPSGVILGAMFNSTLVLSFHDPVTAAGFNVSAGLLPGVILVSVFNQNKLLDARTLSVDRLTSMADFVGFAGMGGITRMTVATAGNPCSDFFGCYFPVIDNLSYSAVIPEPIALWVLGAGLIGVQSLRRLRSCLGRFR